MRPGCSRGSPRTLQWPCFTFVSIGNSVKVKVLFNPMVELEMKAIALEHINCRCFSFRGMESGPGEICKKNWHAHFNVSALHLWELGARSGWIFKDKKEINTRALQCKWILLHLIVSKVRTPRSSNYRSVKKADLISSPKRQVNSSTKFTKSSVICFRRSSVLEHQYWWAQILQSVPEEDTSLNF